MIPDWQRDGRTTAVAHTVTELRADEARFSRIRHDLPFGSAVLVGLAAPSLSLLITIRPAHALMTTEELRAVCEGALENPLRDNPKFAFCTGTALGILMTDALEEDLICAPKDLDTPTALRVFAERAKREPHKTSRVL